MSDYTNTLCVNEVTINKLKIHSKDLSPENMLKAFNEIAILSNSVYSSVDIPEYISKPAEKTLNQMSSKLTHYFNEMKYIDECTCDLHA